MLCRIESGTPRKQTPSGDRRTLNDQSLFPRREMNRERQQSWRARARRQSQMKMDRVEPPQKQLQHTANSSRTGTPAHHGLEQDGRTDRRAGGWVGGQVGCWRSTNDLTMSGWRDWNLSRRVETLSVIGGEGEQAESCHCGLQILWNSCCYNEMLCLHHFCI